MEYTTYLIQGRPIQAWTLFWLFQKNQSMVQTWHLSPNAKNWVGLMDQRNPSTACPPSCTSWQVMDQCNLSATCPPSCTSWRVMDQDFLIYEIILACVMNFITHNKVYCLYPYTTFCDCRSIVWDPAKTKVECTTANKYWERGWQVDHLIQVDNMMKRSTELGVRKRWIGDSLCWVFDGTMRRKWVF